MNDTTRKSLAGLAVQLRAKHHSVSAEFLTLQHVRDQYVAEHGLTARAERLNTAIQQLDESLLYLDRAILYVVKANH